MSNFIVKCKLESKNSKLYNKDNEIIVKIRIFKVKIGQSRFRIHYT